MDKHHTGINRRKYLIVFVIVILCTVGVVEKDLASLVIAEVLIGVLLLSRLYLQINLNSLQIHRIHKTRAYEGDRFQVKLVIESSSWLPIRWIYIKDYFGADVWAYREFLIPQFNIFRTTQTIEYDATCINGRGRYRLGPTETIFIDPLGIWQKSCIVDNKKHLLVLPQVAKIASSPIGGATRPHFVDSFSTHRSGMSYDFFGTREYRYGDSLRYIHWPATAHAGKLIMKEFQLNTHMRLSVFVDLATKSLQGIKPNTLDYSIRVAASVCAYAAEKALEFRIIAHGEKKWMYPFGKGMGHLGWLLMDMALWKAKGKKPLANVLLESLPLFQAGEEVLIIFSTHSIKAQEYINALTILQAKNISITAVFLISDSFETIRSYDKQKELLINAELPALLLARGIKVVLIEKGADISQCFAESVH